MPTSKVNILHIIKSLGRGGAEMLLPETLKLHDKDHFDFHYIYFLPWKNQMHEPIASQGGKVTCLSASNNIQLMLRINAVVRYVKNNDIRLIHAHLPWAGLLARLVGKITGVPVVYTEHNKLERYHLATRLLNVASMDMQQQMIAVSADVAESIRKFKPRLKPVLTTVLNGVNTEHFMKSKVDSQIIRRKFNIPSTAPLIGTIAVFRFQKRLDVWIAIAATILKEKPDAHFIIVGDGPLKQELHTKREALGLQQRLHFSGLETEVRPYLAAFDLYMMSSVFEGLPIALLEAMSMECPVIATAAGGIPEVIRHGSEGLLCAVDTPGELTNLALQLLQNDTLRRSLALNGRKRIEEFFSMEKMVRETEDVYHQLLALPTKP